jgi:hypothetical protein
MIAITEHRANAHAVYTLVKGPACVDCSMVMVPFCPSDGTACQVPLRHYYYVDIEYWRIFGAVVDPDLCG